MRLPGECTGCHRPRQVLVTGAALAGAAARGRPGIPQGLCADCEDPHTGTCRHCDKPIRRNGAGVWGARARNDPHPWYCPGEPHPDPHRRHHP